MADLFSTVAAVVSVADVMIRTCDGISAFVLGLKDAPHAAQYLRQTVQKVQSTLDYLRLYVSEYESSNLFIEECQLLPDIVKLELLEIRAELDFLQRFLPSLGTQGRISQRTKWIRNEKQISEGILRLESRQIALMTGLQIVALRNGIKTYESFSIVRDSVQQTQSSINQRLDELARLDSDNFKAQTSTLNGIRVLAENIPNNHTTTMNKLDQLESILASMRMGEGHLRSTTTFQASTHDGLRRILRAELKRVVQPTVDKYLDSYKSNHELQLEGIRKNLDQIVLDLGRSSQDEDEQNHSKGFQDSIMSAAESDTQDDDSLLRKHTTEKPDPICSGVGLGTLRNSDAVRLWSRSWSRSWTFNWRIGSLMVTISASCPKSRFRPRDCQAFKIRKPSSTRHTYRVSIHFQPAPNLWVRRGISMVCESQHDQRGYYQICPMISTFAIVSFDSEVFWCVAKRDIPGLQGLFEARLAAPTDRDPDSLSLLHNASAMGYNDVCQYLLAEGADPLATTCDGWDCMLGVQLSAMNHYSLDGPLYTVDFYSITRELIRVGLDLDDESFEVFTFRAWQWQRGKSLWENPSKSLMDWTAFLCDLKLAFDHSLNEKMGVSMRDCLLRAHDSQEQMQALTNDVFLLCLLKADVSIREGEIGTQALHILVGRTWSADFSPHFINLAYILIQYGGADVHAVDYDNRSPTFYAFLFGWQEEWLTVLDRCGLDRKEVLRKEVELLHKCRVFGDCESTAIDIEDLSIPTSGPATRRRPVVGDRLDD